jgi:hypothetical protein
VTERAYDILKAAGRVGLILPISVFGTDGFAPLQSLTLKRLPRLWTSCFANRPSQLFDGAQKRLTILLGKGDNTASESAVHTTRYVRWKREERDALFPGRLHYARRSSYFQLFRASLEKIGTALEASSLLKITSAGRTLGDSVSVPGSHYVYYTRKFGYFLSFLDSVPRMENIQTGQLVFPTELKSIGVSSREEQLSAIAVLSSSTSSGSGMCFLTVAILTGER